MATNPRQLLGSLIRPHRWSVVAYGFTLAMATAVPLTSAVLLGQFARLAVDGAPYRKLVPVGVAYAGLGLVASIASVLVTWRGTVLAWKITNRLRHDLAEYVLQADLSFHRDRTPGELVTRVDGDITLMTQFLATVVAQVIAIVALAVGAAVVALIVEPMLLPALLGGLAFIAMVTYSVRNRALVETVAERAAEAEMMGATEQYLAGAEDVAALGAGRHGVARVGDHAADMVLASRHRGREQMTMQTSIRVAISLVEVLMIGYGAFAMSRGWLDVAAVILGFRLIMVVGAKVDHLSWRLQDAQGAAGSAQRVMELVAEQRLVESGTTTLPPGPLDVTFESAGLVYDDDEGNNAAVRPLSLTLEAGRLVGVIGRTGSGKTSLARLVLRLVAPTSGRLTVGGVDLSTVADVDLRRRVTAVPQDVQLFPGTVRDNVTLFSTHDESAVEGALRAVGLGDWLAGLANGLDTRLAADERDDGGSRVGLSAGQAQLLALARALLREPSVVVLDEATSRVDPATQEAIGHAMRRLVEGRTAMVIAHRLETLDICDDIVVLADGAIVEQGERVMLAADPTSRYAQLRAAGGEAELEELR